jgi:predicted transposase/invertase (TIGR01784 family)
MEVANGEIDKRFNIKRELIYEYYRNGYDKKYIRSLFTFIDLIFPLPDDLEKVVSEDIAKFEEEQEMPHVLSWERIAKKEGKKEGIIEGKREGVIEGTKKGKVEALHSVAAKLLEKGISIDIIAETTDLPKKEIEELAAKIL